MTVVLFKFSSLDVGTKFVSAGYWWEKISDTSAKAIDADHPYHNEIFEYKPESLVEFCEL